MSFIRVNRFLKPLSVFIRLNKYLHPEVCRDDKSPKEQQKGHETKCKKAIIVGGTGDIGLATANQLFCAKAAKIALLDTDVCKGDKAISSLNCTFGKNKAIFIKTNVSDRKDIHDALMKAKSELKDVDMIINVFGVWDEIQWEKEVTVNIVGTLNINQMMNDIVVKPGGFVLNVVGLPGIEPFSPSPVLSACFHAIVGYTRSKGHEKNFSFSGIRTVALCAGITESAFSQDVLKKICCQQMSGDLKVYLSETCWQKPEAVAKAVLELYRVSHSGSVWIVEGSRLFSIQFPAVKSIRVLEKQFI
ncbi:hypothetical protein GWI33_017982 [Rhynchophorus ferrugineus]|uniref:Uncharacterized protein n=1 Tax=Rhynchophorus ferrugineus TaxID=354439 RepID=A0A834HX54_RHYFE|nr:hypothetical protein GWI33_017982 [Rhynchophorus ferrugineus]